MAVRISPSEPRGSSPRAPSADAGNQSGKIGNLAANTQLYFVGGADDLRFMEWSEKEDAAHDFSVTEVAAHYG